MKSKLRWGFWLIGGLFLLTGIAWAAAPKLGQLELAAYPLTAVSNHTPWGFKTAKKYWDSMQRINLEVGNVKQFKALPKLGMRNPYTGFIVLGDQDQKFGFIVDIFGEEKRLYVDTDGDGSFAGEKYTLLLNEWYSGANAYLVIGPEPVRLKVRYQGANGPVHPIEVNVSGYIFKPGFLGKEKPFLMVEVRTWFFGEIKEDGVDKFVALVDQNHNGRFNDPEDVLFIDYNNNGFFELEEAIVRKRGIKLKTNRQRITFDWGVYPDQLQVKEGTR